MSTVSAVPDEQRLAYLVESLDNRAAAAATMVGNVSRELIQELGPEPARALLHTTVRCAEP